MNFQFLLSSYRLIPVLIILVLIPSTLVAQSEPGTAAHGEQAVSTPAQSRSAPNVDPGLRLEFIPFRGVVVATEAGSTGKASIEIINQDARPLDIAAIEHSSERFTAALETMEPGRHYRLTVTFEGKGPDGKVAEWLYFKANGEKVGIPVHTEILPRVYAFPKSVDMGKFDLSHIKGNPQTARTVAQILMVYRKNTTGFEIEVTSDIPFLKIDSEQGPDGDRWENTLWLDSERVQPGEIDGTIFIETNDPEVPKLEVPVSGVLLDK
jgi:hypothetical protein